MKEEAVDSVLGGGERWIDTSKCTSLCADADGYHYCLSRVTSVVRCVLPSRRYDRGRPGFHHFLVAGVVWIMCLAHTTSRANTQTIRVGGAPGIHLCWRNVAELRDCLTQRK